MVNELKVVVESFFKSLNSKISEIEGIFLIENVNPSFEAFYGKKSPYKFSFEFNLKNDSQDIELITPSCHLIKTISEYMKNQANTTILKLVFEKGIKEELIKKINFGNYQIAVIDKKIIFDYIFRFVFKTYIKYLNENETIINQVYVHDNSIIANFNIEEFKTSPGLIDEISIIDIKKDYEIAKPALKELLNPRIKKLSEELSMLLNQNIERINSHYSQLSEETIKAINDSELKIKKAEQELKSSKTPNEINKKINNLKIIIEKLRQKLNIDEIESKKEKELLIKNEVSKHSIIQNNVLINKTIVYYPIFSLDIMLKSNKGLRKLQLTFNPLTMQIKGLSCKSCNSPIKEIKFCSSGHLICNNCATQCNNCGDLACKLDNQKKCSVCNRQVCNKCIAKCSVCYKDVCKNHIHTDYIDGKKLCPNCSKQCSSCNKRSKKASFINNLCKSCNAKERIFKGE
jgi:hypothetical protein